MRISSPRLRRIDNALAGLSPDSDAMLLSELDGFLAGVIVCPEPILPGEWLPVVWGEENDGLFADEREAEWYAGLVMDHRDAIVRSLARGAGRYQPFLEVDPRHDEVLWELWIEGFEAAMKLRPESWMRVVESGGEHAKALAGLTTLIEIARDESDLDRETIDALTVDAPRLIPVLVERLNAWRIERGAVSPPAVPLPAGKIGRNQACPCGSGRKHKKCCGQA